MDPFERAIRCARTRTTARAGSATRLGDTLDVLMGRHLNGGHERFSALTEAWERLLPPDLIDQCEIRDFADGRLRVAVVGSAHRYEMQLRAGELLAQLKKQCPRARLMRIELVPA